jgi:hypothetical protein
MTGEDFFGAAVRIIGFGIFLHGLYTTMWGFLYSFWPHYWKHADGISRDSGVAAGQYFFAGGLQLFVGIMIIAEARQIVA